MMYKEICEQWKQPGAAYSPVPFWFWNDTLDRDELVRQLDDFHAKGVDGVVIHPRMGLTGYFTDTYFDLLRTVCAEAEQRQMFLVLYDEGMYPSGSAHGEVVREHPSYAARRLYARPAEEGTEPAANLPEGEDFVCRVYVRMENGLLTEASTEKQDGMTGLDFLLGYTNGTIRGLQPDEDDGQPNAPKAADLLCPEATASFIRHTHAVYEQQLHGYFGTVIRGFFTDEPSLTGRCAQMDGGIVWTGGLLAAFLEAGGTVEQLPALLYATKEKKIRREAQYLYRTVVREQLGRAYYAPLSAWCQAHHLLLLGHPAGSADCDVQQYFDIPGQDLVWRMVEPGTELTSPDSVMAKLAADISRHRGLSRSSSECFGVCGEKGNPWNFTPDTMLWYTHFLFARGCSLLIPHAFYYSLRTPVQTDERPPDVGPHAVWWPEYARIAGYMKRLSWLCAGEDNHPQAAVLCSDEHVPVLPVQPLYEEGYAFNYLTLHDFMEHATVENGKVRLAGYTYTRLLVDGRLRLNGAIAERLAQFSDGGGFVQHGSDFIGAMKKHGKKTSYFEGDTHKNLRFTAYTRSGCPFFLLINEGMEDIGGRLVTDLPYAAARFDAWDGTTEPLYAMEHPDGYAYPLTIPGHAAVVIGLDPEEKPVFGETPVPDLLELMALSADPAQKRMTFDYVPARAHGRMQVLLSFTELHDVADITVNGQPAARLLFRPYTCDITPYLREGENTVGVTMTGSPANVYGTPVPTGFSGCTVRIYDVPAASADTGIAD